MSDQRDEIASFSKGLEYMQQGRVDEAVLSFEKVLRQQPRNHKAFYHLGRLHIAMGRRREAIGCLRAALKISPKYLPPYTVLARLKDPLHDHEISLLQTSLASRKLDRGARAAVYFALAYEFERRERLDDAWRYLERANESKAVHYPADALRRRAEWMIDTFSHVRLSSYQERLNESFRPIFIVGMPRSGTTLVERILMTGSDIESVGEPDLIDHMLDEIANGFDHLGVNEFKRLSAIYMSAFGAPHMESHSLIDKYPMNFWNLGFIQILFSNAVIVHCRRNPMDTCYSCYWQNFDESLNFCFNQSDLVHYYGLYRGLVAHWQEVLRLPIIDVCYEKLVREPVAQSRELVEKCGLPWTTRHLDFYQTQSPLFTASDLQARTAINTNSIGSWKRYEHQLLTLRMGLSEFYEDE